MHDSISYSHSKSVALPTVYIILWQYIKNSTKSKGYTIFYPLESSNEQMLLGAFLSSLRIFQSCTFSVSEKLIHDQ